MKTAPTPRLFALLSASMLLASCDGSGATDAGATDAGATDAGRGLDAGSSAADSGMGSLDAGRDGSASDAGIFDGGTSDAALPDGSTIADSGSGDGGMLTPAELLARNHWEQVGFEDSGRPRMSTPGGNFFVFDGARVHFGCDDATGFPYTLFAGVVTVELPSSRLNWRIVELTETVFSFQEGPDVFHFENRQMCVMVHPDAGP